MLSARKMHHCVFQGFGQCWLVNTYVQERALACGHGHASISRGESIARARAHVLPGRLKFGPRCGTHANAFSTLLSRLLPSLGALAAAFALYASVRALSPASGPLRHAGPRWRPHAAQRPGGGTAAVQRRAGAVGAAGCVSRRGRAAVGAVAQVRTNARTPCHAQVAALPECCCCAGGVFEFLAAQ